MQAFYVFRLAGILGYPFQQKIQQEKCHEPLYMGQIRARHRLP
jgi:hypothetical protein